MVYLAVRRSKGEDPLSEDVMTWLQNSSYLPKVTRKVTGNLRTKA